jgi:hypothetical protein
MVMIRSVALVCSLLTLASSGTSAQEAFRSNTTGFFLNGHVGAAAGNVEDGDTEAGFGGGLLAGYGINPVWQIFLGGDATSIDVSNPDFTGAYTLYQGDVGARLNFPDPSAAFVGYIVGAVTGQFATGTIAAGDNEGRDAELGGFGGTVGTGFQYFFSPALALDTVIQFTFGQYTHADVDDPSVQGGSLSNNLQNWVTRLNVGLTWYPQARR